MVLATSLAAERLEALLAALADADAEIVEHAWDVAEAAHRGQLRKHGRDFIDHPLTVALLLHDTFGVSDGRVLAAALLHDVVEDTTLDHADLDEFPARTRELVHLLTDPHPHMSSDECREHYRAIWDDREATLLKACDRLSNLRDALQHPSPAFPLRYAARTRNEMLAAGMPLAGDPVAGPLLEAALRRCEDAARG